jgi:hypothetical protein
MQRADAAESKLETHRNLPFCATTACQDALRFFRLRISSKSGAKVRRLQNASVGKGCNPLQSFLGGASGSGDWAKNRW